MLAAAKLFDTLTAAGFVDILTAVKIVKFQFFDRCQFWWHRDNCQILRHCTCCQIFFIANVQWCLKTLPCCFWSIKADFLETTAYCHHSEDLILHFRYRLGYRWIQDSFLFCTARASATSVDTNFGSFKTNQLTSESRFVVVR